MNTAFNFEKNRKTARTRTAEELEVVRAKKGKLNKQARGGRTEWESL